MRKWIDKRSLWIIFLQLWIILPVAMAAKLVIVIDDIGYRSKEDDAIYRLPKAVSVAIIPSAPYATPRAKQAYAQQRDVLIHLPMQPQNSRQLIEAGALRVGMSQEQIARLIENAREEVPYAIGLNNHMGSLATTDSQLMQQLMNVLQQHQLFFLDSKTAGKSVAANIARKVGIPTLERHIFLDDRDEISAVQKQFDAAVVYARKYGLAIMIGHPRKNSIAVLERGLANLPADIQLTSIRSVWRGEAIEPQRPFILLFDEAALTSQPPFNSVPLLRGVPKD